jgi:hypothetical protein
MQCTRAVGPRRERQDKQANKGDSECEGERAGVARMM